MQIVYCRCVPKANALLHHSIVVENVVPVTIPWFDFEVNPVDARGKLVLVKIKIESPTQRKKG